MIWKKYATFGTNFLWFSVLIVLIYLLTVSRSSQHAIILVNATKSSDYHGSMSAYHQDQKGWHQDFTIPVVLGSSGVRPAQWYLPIAIGHKSEGDRATPAGEYHIISSFGKVKDPVKLRIPYHKINQNSIFGDDSWSSKYNSWAQLPIVGERMLRADDLYDIGLELNYNQPLRLPFHGSAIFIHKWRNKNTATAGCIAMSTASIRMLLRWLSKFDGSYVVIK
jgi:L,D-peptidoglycan transpeptidase YkuD (ErfK/YbiS/YcfS/YnhG family)